MSETIEVVCDWCGETLSAESKNPHKWGLHVIAKDYNISVGNYVYAILMKPPIKKPLDFCDMDCLYNFAAQELENARIK